ncbi:vesicle-associated membrane protein putativesyntaxin-like protein [Leptomonas pyrrhocoris]|uniref:Vesicle-associated membrane protein putativesyntaxin-like protein n=1 Tax=Leptomonas pyrrhocoris TaxID=157538 RepID=A0A0M9FV49_LEPPY|nr:vesicle-associated membrane protein putativesyntaxin-like protein [Leptomonas pyrrhocoris]KPA76599.1 vesicle-associated membrane protein putativesyntaxin-like protein [Leptomonas pyrrhocoris]|eukprot:XP_015655038.1 vesicle-associated membrane protein putativesyntaxin-like protein [Leptomonas pyrrhocoris]
MSMEDTELKVRNRYDEFAERRAAAHAKYGCSPSAEQTQTERPLLIAPLWSILPSDFEDSALILTQKIEKLSELHRAFLRPKFRSDEEEKRLRDEIDQQTTEIQGFLKKLEHILVAGTQNKPTYSEEESRIVRNIQSQLSTRFKQLATLFKTTQEYFGTQLRRREQKSSKYMKIGSDAAYETVKQEEKMAHFLEMGFTEQDVQSLLVEEMRQEQTSKEIKEILDSIQEIHSMFDDVHNMVVDQGTMLDRIDFNVDKALISASKAQIELEKARERQNSCTVM